MIHTIDGLIATNDIYAHYNEAKELKLKSKTIDKMLEVHTTVIKEYMAETSILYSPTGSEIVTYKAGSERETIDLELLKMRFPQVYKACTVTKPGNRVFLLK